MKLAGPQLYRIAISPSAYTVTGMDEYRKGMKGFHGPTAQKALPKLYIISQRHTPIYVGITRQPMASRLRYGFSADGKHGYHGYAWRNYIKSANLYVWWQQQGDLTSLREFETIEAEIVYLLRGQSQWPKYQTEIHFHPSNAKHRRIAKEVIAYLRKS